VPDELNTLALTAKLEPSRISELYVFEPDETGISVPETLTVPKAGKVIVPV
jgi:hypothetical protein